MLYALYLVSNFPMCFSVDGTREEPGKFGRLINHSVSGNAKVKLEYLDGQPLLVIRAIQLIEKNEEILYDYGDRSRLALEECPWLKQ